MKYHLIFFIFLSDRYHNSNNLCFTSFLWASILKQINKD